ncbi:MAG: putative polymerase sigma factor [Acidimicrobiaceae bacterium]|nr:putative polymerase sigma factor [Acidimicrobiaceae bacterium]
MSLTDVDTATDLPGTGSIGGKPSSQGSSAPLPEPVPASPDQSDIAALWASFRERRDEASRGAIVTTYYPLVKHVARRIAASLAHQVELDDLEGYGAEGLLDAVDRYDTSHGAQFATFAAHRIRGAIYDGIRSTDWAPRSIRRKAREIHTNFGWLCTEHGREPTEAEEASALGVAVDALRSSKSQISGAQIGSLEGRLASDPAKGADPRDPDGEPLAICIANEASHALRAGLALLDERERTVTTLSFDEGLTLAEIGERLGVTESRVCQIRTGAIKRLRAYARAEGLVQA